MNIAIIYSPDWAKYVSVELYAIFKTNPSPLTVYLISDAGGYFDASHIVHHFGEGYKVEFIDAENYYKKKIKTNKNVSSRFTKYALYRLLLPDLINDDRLLYIDADAIVNDNILPLYNIDLSDYYIAGCEDIGADQYNLKSPLGFNKNDLYVNAGILLMNLSKIRQSKLQEKWYFEANNKHYPTHDQDIINKTCKNNILGIDNVYNVSISTGLNVQKEDIRIAHFAGVAKPWSDSAVPNAPVWFKWAREYRKLFGGM